MSQLKFGEKELFIIHTSISPDKWIEGTEVKSLGSLNKMELLDYKEVLEQKLNEIKKYLEKAE